MVARAAAAAGSLVAVGGDVVVVVGSGFGVALVVVVVVAVGAEGAAGAVGADVGSSCGSSGRVQSAAADSEAHWPSEGDSVSLLHWS